MSAATSSHIDVVIVGAGPTGLMLAGDLAAELTASGMTIPRLRPYGRASIDLQRLPSATAGSSRPRPTASADRRHTRCRPRACRCAAAAASVTWTSTQPSPRSTPRQSDREQPMRIVLRDDLKAITLRHIEIRDHRFMHAKLTAANSHSERRAARRP